MTNPLLSTSEQAHVNAVRSRNHTNAQWVNPTLSSAALAALATLDRVDWNKVFSRVAIVLNAVGVLYVTYVYSVYVAYFGYAAIAFIGQFLIGLFFLNVVVSTTDSLQVMLASVGMFILANSF